MPSGTQIASHAAPATQNGQTGSFQAGGSTPASRAINVISSFNVVTSPPARMYVRFAAAGTSPHNRNPSTRSSMYVR